MSVSKTIKVDMLPLTTVDANVYDVLAVNKTSCKRVRLVSESVGSMLTKGCYVEFATHKAAVGFYLDTNPPLNKSWVLKSAGSGPSTDGAMASKDSTKIPHPEISLIIRNVDPSLSYEAFREYFHSRFPSLRYVRMKYDKTTLRFCGQATLKFCNEAEADLCVASCFKAIVGRHQIYVYKAYDQPVVDTAIMSACLLTNGIGDASPCQSSALCDNLGSEVTRSHVEPASKVEPTVDQCQTDPGTLFRSLHETYGNTVKVLVIHGKTVDDALAPVREYVESNFNVYGTCLMHGVLFLACQGGECNAVVGRLNIQRQFSSGAIDFDSVEICLLTQVQQQLRGPGNAASKDTFLFKQSLPILHPLSMPQDSCSMMAKSSESLSCGLANVLLELL